MRHRSDLSTWTGAHAFTICAAGFLLAAATIAIVHPMVYPITRGWWLVAYLSLVGGLSQLLLGPGLVALARRSRAAPPAAPAQLRRLVLWNFGTLAVAAADLAPSAAGVMAGSVVLVAALLLFGRGVQEARTTARQPAPAWTAAYTLLLAFLVLSVVVGTVLAYARGR